MLSNETQAGARPPRSSWKNCRTNRLSSSLEAQNSKGGSVMRNSQRLQTATCVWTGVALYWLGALALYGDAAGAPRDAPAADSTSSEEKVKFYESRIRPLLVDRCYRCHSEKAETVEADLYVDSRDGLLKGGDQGAAVEPGEPERSLLIQAVEYTMDDLKMPPDRKLDEEQIRDLRKWVKDGVTFPAKAPAKSVLDRGQIDVKAARQR